MIRESPKAGMVPAVLPLLLVLLGIGSDRHFHGGVGAQSSDTDVGFCLDELADCAAATVCTSCVFDFAEGTCTDYEFDEGDSCSLLGTAYCCAAEASGLTCESDGYTLEYWECALERSGCTLLDMPCMVEGASGSGVSGDVGSSVGEPEVISSDGDVAANGLEDSGAGRGGSFSTVGGVTAALVALAATAVATGGVSFAG